MAKIFVYFFAMIILQFVSGILCKIGFGLFTGNQDLTAMQIIVSSSVASIATIAVFVLAKWTPFSRDYIQQRPWATLFWCIIMALGMLIPSQFIEELIPDSLRTDVLADQFKMVMGNNWGYLAVGLLAPIAEELVFRGAIQRAAIQYFDKKFAASTSLSDEATTLRKNMPHWIGITLTALLFALIHGNPAQMPHAFLIGLLLGWMCYRSGSIVPGIVVHWVNNTIAFCMCAMYPQSYDTQLSDLFDHSTMRITLAIVFSLMIFIPAIYQFHIRTKKA